MKNERQMIPDKNWQFGSAALILLCFIGFFVFFDRLISTDLNQHHLFFLLILKWLLLSVWSLLLLLLVKFYVESRFALFIKRIEKQMTVMIAEKPHYIKFRKRSFHNWKIDCLNKMIESLCLTTTEKEDLLNEIKIELEKCIKTNNFQYIETIPLKIKNKFKEII